MGHIGTQAVTSHRRSVCHIALMTNRTHYYTDAQSYMARTIAN
jgi:hypothetical protein